MHTRMHPFLIPAVHTDVNLATVYPVCLVAQSAYCNILSIRFHHQLYLIMNCCNVKSNQMTTCFAY